MNSKKKVFFVLAGIFLVVVLFLIIGHGLDKHLDTLQQGSEDMGIENTESKEPYVEPEREWEIYDKAGLKGTSEIELGTIKVSYYLYQALMKFNVPDEEFELMVFELTDASDADIRQRFILDQSIREGYLEKSIYVTRAQMEQLHCPEDMAIVLRLKAEESWCLYLNERILDIFDEDVLEVEVCVDDEELENLLKELRKIDTPTGEIRIRTQECVEKILNPIISDYHIAEEALLYKGTLRTVFTANISKETIRALLADERIAWIIKEKEGIPLEEY